MKQRIRGFIRGEKAQLLFVALFALVAAGLLIATRAAGPSVFVEGETALTGNAALFPTSGTDSTLSGGRAVQFKKPATGSTFIAAAGDIAGSWSTDTTVANRLNADSSISAVLAAGDLAYPNGTETEFDYYKQSWGIFKTKTYPAPGNHEYFDSTSAVGYKNYWTSAGRFAGDPLPPSAVKVNPTWYSFNIGGWHIISLDSEKNYIGTTAWNNQLSFLDSDLAADNSACTIAYWHSPFIAGSGNGISNGQTKDFMTRLYNDKADIVIAGHEHAYNSFDQVNPNGSIGSGTTADPNGIRSFVVGTGGTGMGNDDANTMPIQLKFLGSGNNGFLKLELKPTSYTWQFINSSGSVLDSGSDSCVV